MAKNDLKHKVTKKDLEANDGALESAGVKAGDVVGIPVKDTVILTATKNTTLADGKFVKQGEQVEVSVEYAERVKKEKASNFK